MTNMHRRLIVFFTGIGITLLVAGLVPLVAVAQEETPMAPTPSVEEIPEFAPTEPFYDLENVPPIEPTGDNSYCVMCHNRPLQTVTLHDGRILNLYVSPEIIANSVHGVNSEGGQLGCIDCHTEDSIPHSGPTPTDQREYTFKSVTFCINCHTDQVDALQHGLHEQAIARGNDAAAVCTDCHGSHDIRPVAQFPELVAGVCGDCHATTLAEWRSSKHVDIGPLDCATCHSPHTQEMRGGLTVNELCVNCHKEVPDIFAHTQHLDREEPVGCYECHMFVPQELTGVLTEAVDVSTAAVPVSTGHTFAVQTAACNACHEELVVSGEWERLRTQPQVSEVASVPSETETTEAETQPVSNVQFLQGLILGAGFGITAAAVFVARGNRRIRSASEDETD
ncbi:MAG: cytochrome c3 family protein [Anaerolineae bacterium]|nr:cytochrome c3 family protein [Anaerolineae bacterium]